MRRWESKMERAGRPWRMSGLLIVWAIGGHFSGSPLADSVEHTSVVSHQETRRLAYLSTNFLKS